MTEEEGIYTSLQSLVRLRYTAGGFSYLPKQPVRSLLAGRKRSKLRGRGLDFDELRHYRPGDDIRTMDWRVTNRTGKPHVRVYTEERDRPVIVVVDQRLPMFFGSELKMKSVVAAEVAAMTAWRVLGVGDRIGAILFNDERILDVRPSRSEKKVMAWLGDLETMNRQLSVNSGTIARPEALAEALDATQRMISHDYLVILVSDFFGWDERSLQGIRRIGEHNDIICTMVYDPLERDISSADQLVVSDGRYQLEIDPVREDLGQRFEASVESSYANVQAELLRHQIPVIPVHTSDSTAAQLRKQLGGQRVLQ
ncbi:DUF58 domain-containing protein [Halioglobus maricola]|uniref:DUF58 domain-containing protein n=1 Tax=Halioglobus maricola TaxID=2601894 RepID=UPI001F1053DC|nr:DUF58 domain-containing protein [Halioglobus maricola]